MYKEILEKDHIKVFRNILTEIAKLGVNDKIYLNVIGLNEGSVKSKLYKHFRKLSKRCKIETIEEGKMLMITCTYSEIELNKEYEMQLKLPKQDYAKVKVILKSLVKNSYVKTIVENEEMFCKYVNLVKDKHFKILITKNATYRKNELKIKRI